VTEIDNVIDFYEDEYPSRSDDEGMRSIQASIKGNNGVGFNERMSKIHSDRGYVLA